MRRFIRAVLGRESPVRCSPERRSGCAPPEAIGLRSSGNVPAALLPTALAGVGSGGSVRVVLLGGFDLGGVHVDAPDGLLGGIPNRVCGQLVDGLHAVDVPVHHR